MPLNRNNTISTHDDDVQTNKKVLFGHLESLEVVYEDVGEPELVDKLQVHWDHGLLSRMDVMTLYNMT